MDFVLMLKVQLPFGDGGWGGSQFWFCVCVDSVTYWLLT